MLLNITLCAKFHKKLMNGFKDIAVTGRWTDRLSDKPDFIGPFWHARNLKTLLCA